MGCAGQLYLITLKLGDNRIAKRLILSLPNPTGKGNRKRFNTVALSSRELTSMGVERGGKKFFLPPKR